MSDAPFGPAFTQGLGLFFPPLGPAGGSSGPVVPRGWDRCVLGGDVMPGFSRITRGGIALKVDKKKKAGAHGANPTFHGIDPQPIQLEVETFSDVDREALAKISLGIRAKMEKTAKQSAAEQQKDPLPMSIDHPSLRAIGVTSVVVMGMSAMIVLGPMKAKQTFELLDWLPTTKELATVTPTTAPTRKPKIVRAGSSENVPPTKQPGFGGPPPGLRK